MYVCVRKYFMFLWIYKISFMSLAVAFPVYRLAQQRLPQNFFHLRLLPACLPFAPPPSPVTYPLQPCDGIPSKFGATLSNYLYGIHNFCWWSFSPKPLSLAYDGRVICVNKCLWNWILRMAQGGRVGVGWGRYARRTALQVAFALSLLGLGDISLALALKLSA